MEDKKALFELINERISLSPDMAVRISKAQLFLRRERPKKTTQPLYRASVEPYLRKVTYINLFAKSIKER